MKKITSLLSFVLFFHLCISCSNHDEDSFVPPIPGKDLSANELQIVFQTTPEEYEISFSLKSGSNDIVINWGDNAKLHEVASGEVNYTYPPEEATYVITITSPKLSHIDITDELSYNITGVYLGYFPELSNISIPKKNRFEAFDIRSCPQFNSAYMQINTDNFDMEGLKNASSLVLYLSINSEIEIKGYTHLETLYVSLLDGSNVNKFNSIKVEGCPTLNSVEIVAYANIYNSNYNYYYPLHLEELELKIPTLNSLRLRGLCIGKELDLRNAGSECVDVILYSFNPLKNLFLSSATRNLHISNLWRTMNDFNIEELDLSNCNHLGYVSIEGLSSLKDIKGGNMKSFWMQNCPLVTTLDFNSLSSLENISCYNNGRLESVTMNTLPSLKKADLTYNKMLSDLTGTQLPELAAIDLKSNQLGEQTIMSFINALPDELSSEGKQRKLNIQGNPGNTENVHTLIESKQYWQIVEDSPQGGTSRSNTSSASTIKGMNDNVIHLRAK